MRETELLKELQLSSTERFLTLARFTRSADLNTITKKVLEDRLATLGYKIEYGCCGVNHLERV